MEKSKSWFEVDVNGLRSLQAGKPYKPYGRKLTDTQERIIGSEYLNGKSIEDIIRITGIGEKTVRNALRRTATNKRTKSQAQFLFYQTEIGKEKSLRHSKNMKRHSVNDNFFSEPLNPMSAYVLGFWMADGHLEKRNRNFLSISQMEEGILIKIRNALDSSYPIYRKRTHGKEHGFLLGITSRQLCEDVRKLCPFLLSGTKSMMADYPIIPEELDSHFIRGVFDGDGCILKNGTQLAINITGTFDLIEKIQERFIKNCGVSRTKISDRGNFCQMNYHGNKQVPRIMNWLYKDAGIFLERKRDFFETAVDA